MFEENAARTSTLTIDGRGRADRDILLELRRLYSDNEEAEISLEVLVDSRPAAKRVAAYSAMSHLKAGLEERDGAFAVFVWGAPCRCGFA